MSAAKIPRMVVIVPVRDTPALPGCVGALLSGSVCPDHLVVVDDGSRRPVSGLPSDVHVIRQPPRGPAAARNLGARQHEADILVFVDADVEVGPDTLKKLLSRLQDPKNSAVQAVYAPEPPAPGFANDFQNLYQHYNFIAASRAETFCGLSSYCVAIRREAFEAVGGFDESIGRATVEDDNLGLALVAAGHRIVIAPEILVTHRAQVTPLGLMQRMTKMARDKVRSVKAKPWRARHSPKSTHHRPGFLLAAGATGTALLLLPVSPPLAALCLGLALLAQADFLGSVARRRGPVFAGQSAALILLLAASAAAGSVLGALVT